MLRVDFKEFIVATALSSVMIPELTAVPTVVFKILKSSESASTCCSNFLEKVGALEVCPTPPRMKSVWAALARLDNVLKPMIETPTVEPELPLEAVTHHLIL